MSPGFILRLFPNTRPLFDWRCIPYSLTVRHTELGDIRLNEMEEGQKKAAAVSAAPVVLLWIGLFL